MELYILQKKINIKPEDIYFIGDTPTDLKTAKNSNMKNIGILWRFRTKKGWFQLLSQRLQ